MNDKVSIVQLDTGVPGLNEVLGGGLPEFSFNLLAGGPGAGKTTLVHQICFALATPERPALYITVLGEPPLKLLRYQQQFSFFDPAKINTSLRFFPIDHAVLEAGLGKVLEQIVAVVEATTPQLVVVDSFRSVVRGAQHQDGQASALPLEAFVQRLALHLTSWQATTFLVGEYQQVEKDDNPIFTVADSIIWLNQSVERSSIVRKLQVVKMRGQAPVPGLQTFRITGDGVTVFPRLPIPKELTTQELRLSTVSTPIRRLTTGVQGLDEMLDGGVPVGSSLLVVGPSGSGKTILSMQFLAAGITAEEPGLLAVFEKRPSDYFKSSPVGGAIARHVQDGSLHVVYLRPLDLSIDETMEEIRTVVQAHGVKRVVIDSLSGLELALAPSYREDFRETLHRMVSMLTALGITLLLTVEVVDSYIDLRFSPHGTAFLTDGILLQRYIELDGQLKRLMGIVKLRGSQHSKDLRLYEITNQGLIMGRELRGYEGLMTGSPRRLDHSGSQA